MNHRAITTHDILFLSVGEAIITNKAKLIWTVLGSCVSVTLYNKRTKWGAICHCLLPEKRMLSNEVEKTIISNSNIPHKKEFLYVKNSVEFMIKRFFLKGIYNKEIEANIYGGACVLQYSTGNCVGDKNVEMAKAVLTKHNIPFTLSDIGGTQGRNLYFFADTNESYVFKHNATI